MPQILALVASVALGGPAECADPPSRASSHYWTYIDNCGCAKLEAPSRASSDYDRFARACSQWRERNPPVVAASPRPAPECASVPSRAAGEAYWTYIDNCGCAQLDTPSRASSDYDRFAKACSQWRARNPAAAASPTPK